MRQNYNDQNKEFAETVVQINRVSKKTKGGNQMRFAALVVVGDRKGRVGVGLAKAKDVRGAIQKSISAAKRKMVTITLKGTTIPYEVSYKYGAARVFLKPAPEGTGIIAGGAIRVIMEAVGVRNVSAKILGTKNKITNLYATVNALSEVSALYQIKQEKSKKI
jgi:small subunit ribosomal protein S5